MRRLIVCCDGTWNTKDQDHDGVPVPTNVVRIFNATLGQDAAGVSQLKYYHPGVGTEGSRLKKLVGGGIGIGVNPNIMSAYQWLASEYESGDQIYLFGFSRGAYTVRSLGGMLCQLGLLKLKGLSDDDKWERVTTLFERGYQNKEAVDEWGAAWSFHTTDRRALGVDADNPNGVGIHFIGVWDTVGALGVPNDVAFLNLLLDDDDAGFHDTMLSEKVNHARHAVALDEQRASFTPTMWTGVEGRDTVKQVWFPGVHSDVGGGYLQKGLSDGALKWMMDEASDLGLALSEKFSRQVKPNFQDVLHDSHSGIFEHLPTQPRNIPLLHGSGVKEELHESAWQRWEDPPIEQAVYHPSTVLDVAESKSVDVFAVQPWNRTGIYLEANAEYRFKATGQWMDKSIKSAPDGSTESGIHFGEMVRSVGTLLGQFEKAFKKMTHNEEADFKGTRREEDMPWFSLVGAVANAGNPADDGTPAKHQIFEIGKSCTLVPSQSGYLYCFANDAWNFYSNNRGSVKLTVERIS